MTYSSPYAIICMETQNIAMTAQNMTMSPIPNDRTTRSRGQLNRIRFHHRKSGDADKKNDIAVTNANTWRGVRYTSIHTWSGRRRGKEGAGGSAKITYTYAGNIMPFELDSY